MSHLYPGVRFVKKLLFGVVTLLNSNNNENRKYDIRASNCLLKVFSDMFFSLHCIVSTEMKPNSQSNEKVDGVRVQNIDTCTMRYQI